MNPRITTIELILFQLCGLAVAVISASLVTGEPDATAHDEYLGEWTEQADW